MLRTKGIALLLAVCMLLCGCQNSAGSQTQDLSNVLIDPEKLTQIKYEYDTGFAKNLVYEEEAKTTSSVVCLQEDALTWDQPDSRLEQFHVKKGETVREGQVLATFTVTIDKVKLETLKLQLEKKKQDIATKKQAAQDAVAKAETAEKGLNGYALQIAQLKTEKQRIALEQLEYETELELGVLSAQVEEIEAAAANVSLVAPYHGIITYVRTSVKAGDSITAGETLIEIEASDKIFVKATNSTCNDGSVFRYNSLVTVGGSEGRVVVSPNILPEGDQGIALIEMTTGNNRSFGNKAVISKVHEVYDVMLVSTKALQSADDYYYVNVLDGDILKRRRVTVALRNPDKYTWILDGLTDGQTIVFGQ